MPTPIADPAVIAAVQDVLKEVWTTDALENQLLEDLVLFEWMDDVKDHTDSDGLKATVPLRTGRTSGISSRGINQKLGPAGHQRVGKASYNYTFHYLTIKVLGPVMARMKTSRQSAVRELDLEVKNGLNDIKQDWQRQLHMDGSAAIAKVSAYNSGTKTVTIDPTDLVGRHALRVGWIYEGMNIDIGSLADPTAAGVGQFLTVSTVDEDAGTFTLVTGAASIVAGQFIFRHGNRSAANGGESYEMNGLGNIISATASLGGLAPASNTFWKATVMSNSGTLRALSTDLLLRTENKVRQKGGKVEVLIGDLDQERRYYNLLQPQVRYAGDSGVNSTGNAGGIDFNGKKFVGDAHSLPNRIRMLNKGAFQMYSAGELAWQNQTTGGDILSWVQDEDAFVARAAKYCQVGTDRRNTLAEVQDLDAS